MAKILNIIKLREFDDKERDFFIFLYKSLLELRKDYSKHKYIESEEYQTLFSFDLLCTREEMILYKRDNIIDTTLNDQ